LDLPPWQFLTVPLITTSLKLSSRRSERARLLGYPTFAHYRLDDTMAKT
jgi:Zn-dependent oligopeptidase